MRGEEKGSELTEASSQSGREDAPSGWQPIDTAPRDGTVILLTRCAWLTDVSDLDPKDVGSPAWRARRVDDDAPKVYHQCWVTGGFWSSRWNNWNDGVEPSGLASPTHWLPLPAAPDGGAGVPVHAPAETATGSEQDLILSLTKEVEGLKESLRDIAGMTDPDSADAYRADDREGCLDTVYAVAARALSTSGRAS